MLDKLWAQLSRYIPAFLQPRPPHHHADALQCASAGLAMLAGVSSILRFGSRVPVYKPFQSYIVLFIAHSIVFGYQRVLNGVNRLSGASSAVTALSAFILGAMEMRRREEMGGMVIVAGGVAGLLYGLNVRNEPVVASAGRWMVAVAVLMLILGKGPGLIRGRGNLVPATLMLASASLQLCSFPHSHQKERGLASFLVVSAALYGVEVILAVIALLRFKFASQKRVRHYTRSAARKKPRY